MAVERCRDVAHVPAVEFRTQLPPGTSHTHGTPPVEAPG